MSCNVAARRLRVETMTDYATCDFKIDVKHAYDKKEGMQ